MERVKRNGGYVFGGRVSGRLAIARAFGDHEMKVLIDPSGNVTFQTYLTVIPEIRQIQINPETDDFVLLASDGLYDKMSSQECVDFIHEELKQMPATEQNLKRVAKKLSNHVIFVKKVLDNVTIIIIGLNRG